MTPQDAPAGPVLGEAGWLAVADTLRDSNGWITVGEAATAVLAALEPAVVRLLSSAREEGRKEGREDAAREVLLYATNYPEDIFPADSDSRDAIAGTALRTVLPRVARVVGKWSP